MWFLVFIFGLVYGGKTNELESCRLAAKGKPYFPENFNFGVATSAYQIEGGWNEDGKGPSTWDDFTHDYPAMIGDRSNSDVAADSYHRFDQDLEALKELKVNSYRFSIAWTRIFPTGDIASKNQRGIDYYNNIIDKLLENDIEPIVQMFHFDLPAAIQENGGLINPDIINQFEAYARELFEIFGDRVKTWVTFNEPLFYCRSSYGDGIYPPQIRKPGEADYICMDNTLKAHATAYHTYKSEFYEKQGGKIGISIISKFYYSESNGTDVVHHEAVQFDLGIQAHPIFSKSGGYPEIVVSTVAENSLTEGLNTTRLPDLDGKWRQLIKGSADFLGLNYYTANLLKRASNPKGENFAWTRDLDYEETPNPKWIKPKPSWFYCVPQGLEDMLKFIRDEYNNVEVILLENGWPDNGYLEDNERISYVKSHLQAVLNAINDGCNVTGYLYWSLVDAFEWIRGFTIQFGLYSVDLQSERKDRVPRKSAKFYRNVIETKMIPNETKF